MSPRAAVPIVLPTESVASARNPGASISQIRHGGHGGVAGAIDDIIACLLDRKHALVGATGLETTAKFKLQSGNPLRI